MPGGPVGGSGAQYFIGDFEPGTAVDFGLKVRAGAGEETVITDRILPSPESQGVELYARKVLPNWSRSTHGSCARPGTSRPWAAR